MINWLKKLTQQTNNCEHNWQLIDSFRGENGFGLIGYRWVYKCSKCGKLKETTYYP